MPSDTLDLLDEIVKGAEGAAGKGPGQPLRADDWNTLAEAVVRLARLAAARERGQAEALAKSYARADHVHLGEVDLTWFEPATRALVEARGGAGDVAARLDGLAREAKALRGEVSALTGQVERLRDRLADAATEDRVREADVLRLGTRLDGVIDLDRRVTVLDGRVAGIDDGVRDALAFRDTLRDPNGEPLDVADLVGRVDTLAAAQERLRLADGEVVRIRDFQNRIADLEQRAVTDANLDTRLAARLDALAAAPDSPLVSRAAGAAAATLDPRLAALEGGLAGTNTALDVLRNAGTADRTRIAEIDTRLATETARGDRTATGLERLDPLVGRMTAVEATANTATQRLGTLDAVQAELGQLRTQVTTAVTLAPRVTALETTTNSTEGRLAATETAVQGLPDLRQRITQAEVAATRADAVGGRINTLQQGLAFLGGQVTVANSRLAAMEGLDGRVSVFERNMTEITSWRRGVDERLAVLPTRSAIDTLTARVSTVERRTSDLGVRITEIDTTRPIVRPIR